MKGVTALLLFTLLASAVCMAMTPTSGSGQSGAVVRTLDGKAVTTAELEASIEQAMAKANLAGLSVAIINDGQIAYTHAFGDRDKGARIPFDTETVTVAASLSKTVFAYLVMLLVEEGVIDLDTPLQAYLSKPLPEYPGYVDLAGDERYKQITARMVLSHSTGFPNWRRFQPDKRLTFLFDPGARYSYSGEGFALLQMVVEEITGQDLETLAQKKVFAPLGMTRTSYVWQKAFAGDVAQPHDQYGRAQRLMQRLMRRSKPDAAGSLVTTAGDYARLLAAILNSTGERKATMDEMLRPQVTITSERMFGPGAWQETTRYQDMGLAWGLGWGRFDTAQGPAFFHTGNDVDYQNYTVTYPDQGIGVVLLSNSANFEGVAPEILRAAIGDVYSPFEWLGYGQFDPAAVQTTSREPLLVAVLVVLVIVALAAGVAGLWTNRKLRRDPDYAALKARHPEGYWVGIGMALGLVLGIPFSAAMQTAAGMGVGVAIGAGMGASLERRHAGDLRPLTGYEKRSRGCLLGGAVGLLVLLALAAAALLWAGLL